MLPALPKAKELLADKGYDADWFRAAPRKASRLRSYKRVVGGGPSRFVQ